MLRILSQAKNQIICEIEKCVIAKFKDTSSASDSEKSNENGLHNSSDYSWEPNFTSNEASEESNEHSDSFELTSASDSVYNENGKQNGGQIDKFGQKVSETSTVNSPNSELSEIACNEISDEAINNLSKSNKRKSCRREPTSILNGQQNEIFLEDKIM